MKNEVRLLLNFGKLGVAAFSKKLNVIIAAMTGNIYYGGAASILARLVVAQAAYLATSLKVASGDLEAKAQIKIDKAAVVAILKEMARYIEMVANENRAMLVSSGYDVSKETKETITLGVPQNLTVSDGDTSGELYETFGAVTGAKSYSHQTTADPLTDKSVWTSEGSSVSCHTFKNLPSGTKVWVRVVAIGSNDQKTYSAPVARTVQ